MLQAEPGAANVVSEKVVLTMDTRSISGPVSDAIESDIRRLINAAAEKYRVSIDVEVVLDILSVAVGDDMRAMVRGAAAQAGVAHMDVISWAVHDAQEVAQYAPAGMLFVPCVEGRSHCPQEFTREEDIAAGTAVLANVLLALAA